MQDPFSSKLQCSPILLDLFALPIYPQTSSLFLQEEYNGSCNLQFGLWNQRPQKSLCDTLPEKVSQIQKLKWVILGYQFEHMLLQCSMSVRGASFSVVAIIVVCNYLLLYLNLNSDLYNYAKTIQVWVCICYEEEYE